MSKVKVVAVSDTHNQISKMTFPSGGDILVHAGDFTGHGTLKEIAQFNQDVAVIKEKYGFKHVVCCAGNHDFGFERDGNLARALLTNVHYLEDSMITLEGLNFYGSPHTPFFYNWAFNLQRGEPLRRKWSMIPEGIDILITHGPPMGYGDVVESGESVGCRDLTDRIKLVKPRVVCSGHIHEGYGVRQDQHGIKYINASSCTLEYKPTNPPIEFEV